MKLRPIFFIFMLVVLLASACGPTTTPTAVQPATAPAPTESATGSGDPTWDRILDSGKIIFGTSADYSPYEYYDDLGNLDGFDMAIARELAMRLGLQIEIKDYAFEGLPIGMQTGDIDVAIAAISVTAERQTQVDFSNVYLSGTDAVLARQGSGIPKITSATQLASYRVGVQRGTTYEKYMQQYLVEPGYMPAANLLQYEKPEHAVRDLKANYNDLVLMGAVPAQEYVAAGGVEIGW